MNGPTFRLVLDAERASTLQRIQNLAGELDGIIATSVNANLDDEHDPEGSTVAFERAQVTALLSQARAYLADLDLALSKLDSGRYSTCERCDEKLGEERLAARPAARLCFSCASTPPG